MHSSAFAKVKNFDQTIFVFILSTPIRHFYQFRKSSQASSPYHLIFRILSKIRNILELYFIQTSPILTEEFSKFSLLKCAPMSPQDFPSNVASFNQPFSFSAILPQLPLLHFSLTFLFPLQIYFDVLIFCLISSIRHRLIAPRSVFSVSTSPRASSNSWSDKSFKSPRSSKISVLKSL